MRSSHLRNPVLRKYYFDLTREVYMTFQIDHMKFQIDQVTQKGVLTALPIIGADFLQAMLNPQSEFSCGITG